MSVSLSAPGFALDLSGGFKARDVIIYCEAHSRFALAADFPTIPSNASRRPDGGGVVCDLGGLEEEVLFLFERFEIGVEAFEQGKHPFFAVIDLLSDLSSGAFDPVDLAFYS